MPTSIQLKISKYIPEDFAVMAGSICSKCKKPFDPITLCPQNLPYGHIPDVVILKIGENQSSVNGNDLEEERKGVE